MRLRKAVFAIFLPLSATIAVVGGGFSVWYFAQDNQAKMDNTIEVKKKVPNEFGTLSVTFGEADSKYYAADGESPMLIISQKSVTFPTPVNITFTWNAQKEEDIGFNNFTYTFSYKITLNTVFADYFQLYAPQITTDENVEGLWNGTEDMEITDFTSNITGSFECSIGYQHDKEPASNDDYKKLRGELETITGSLMSFEFLVTPKLKDTIS